MSEQFYLRDDLIEFTNKLDSECYNVKAYRKRKSKSKKISFLDPKTTDVGRSLEDILHFNKNADKNQRTYDKINQRRLSMTAGLKNRIGITQNLRSYNKSVNIKAQLTSHKKQQVNQVKTAKINYNNENKSERLFQNIKLTQRNIEQNVAQVYKQQKQMTQTQQKNVTSTKQKNVTSTKYQQIQQKYHKNGPISEKVIQNWLNQILIQYCSQQIFDKSIQNSALKKMSLDRNSLLSQGIKPQYVNRVYKSMFVYSIGFNNLLKQLSGKNTLLKKTIWKVYAILLEFCSEGSFQTMIGEIERDKARKIQSLRNQIQKRQHIIENNDQINADKNAKIFKELKLLREENTNLENQKNVLMEDFKEAEQSFNQEVSLRLKFQNKINQIHGIHHQLVTKHARLYEDHQKKNALFEKLEIKNQQLNQKILVIKEKLGRTADELIQEQKQNTTQKQIISKYEQMRTRFENSQIQLKNSKQDLVNIIKQKSRKISQLQVQSQNCQIMMGMARSSTKQLQGQYRQSLGQNRKLYQTIKDQIDQLNTLYTQKKSFNEKHMSYVAQIQFLKNKDSQNKIIIQKLKKQIKLAKQTYDTLLIQKTSLQKKVQRLQKDLAACYDNIQDMKRTKNIYQQQLVFLKKKSQIHGQVVRQKETLLITLTKDTQKLTKQNQQLITLNKTLDSRSTVLVQRLRSQQQINKKRYDKLKQERDELFKQNSAHKDILQQKLDELEKYMNLYDKEMLNLKNQRFQRVNLDLRYKQSLHVMENQNQHIRNLNITISQNHQEIQECQRKYRNLEYIMKQKEHIFQIEKNSLKMHLDQANQQVIKKKMYINPMLLQDMKGLLKRALEKNALIYKQYEEAQRNSKIKQIQMIKNQKNLQQTLVQTIKQQQLKSQKIVQQKQYQLSFQKQKNKHLKQKVVQYEKLLQANSEPKQKTSGFQTSKDKERKYLSTIKQKSQQIQKLLQQLESAHDHNNTFIKRISQIESIIIAKDNEISQLDKRLSYSNQQYAQNDRQKSGSNHPLKKQTIQSRNDDYSQNLAAMNTQTHTSNGQSKQKKSHNNKNRKSSGHQNGNGKQTNKEQSLQKQQIIQNDRNNISSNKKQRNQKIVQPAWRNDLGKKLVNAYNYYQK